jgi:hypothetical protein
MLSSERISEDVAPDVKFISKMSGGGRRSYRKRRIVISVVCEVVTFIGDVPEATCICMNFN